MTGDIYLTKGKAVKIYHATKKGQYYLAVEKGERKRNFEYEKALSVDPEAEEVNCKEKVVFT